MITVTKPFLPPVDTYKSMVDQIWNNHWLTNHGPMAGEFEKKLADLLKVRHLQYITNGTVALQIAYRALDLKGEVLTTPFSFIATASSLVWEHCRPVFVDIDPATFNMDVNKVEEKITDQTTGIVATHVYGNPCEVDLLESIAARRELKLVFDAAHCFGVNYKGRSILECGDVSMLSLHATKIFHSTEGGILVTRDKKLHDSMWSLKNFGFEKEEVITGLGINGKNSEFHAAMGLCNLPYAGHLLDKYKFNYLRYKNGLTGHGRLSFQELNADGDYNHAYFPVLFSDEQLAKTVKKVLQEKGIQTRRYFYPALNAIPYLQGEDCPVAHSVASRILCLPMSYYLEIPEIDLICETIINTITK